jgi:predicted CopG family antitoxin
VPGNKAPRSLREQMESAARSGKQNIVEGAEQKIDSGGYTYLLGVARGSLAELLEDYRDFARNHNLEIWMRGDQRIEDFKKRVEKVKKAERVRYISLLLSPRSLSQGAVSIQYGIMRLCIEFKASLWPNFWWGLPWAPF